MKKSRVLWYGQVVDGVQQFHEGPAFDSLIDAVAEVHARFGVAAVSDAVTNMGFVFRLHEEPVARIVLE